MPKSSKLLLMFALILALASCREWPGIAGPDTGAPAGMTQDPGDFTADITLDSAIVSIYVAGSSGQVVNLHAVTAPWVENMVTWNNFAGAYVPGIIGSFTANAVGWYSVNITTFAQGWLDGATPNYGLLLEQAAGSLTAYASSEDFITTNHPMLHLWWSEGGIQEHLIIQRGVNGVVYDSYIREDVPEANFGESPVLYTGYLETFEKQTLVKFEMPVVECDTAAIGDRVWLDENCDGIQDRGELGVPRVTVKLYSCRDTVLVDTEVTDADGQYIFTGIMPGMYFLHVILPDGHEFSPMDQGTDDCVDSDVNPRGLTECFTVDSCETDFCWDIGLCRPDTDEGCTRTIGYWKNHAGFGPQDDVVTPLLPIWLGTPDSSTSIAVTTAQIAYDILTQHVYGEPSNGITKLYAQLLAAKLNIAAGADPDDVSEAIAFADAFLALYDWEDWDDLTQDQKRTVLRLKGVFDSYNNGFIGPGHCDDEDDDF